MSLHFTVFQHSQIVRICYILLKFRCRSFITAKLGIRTIQRIYHLWKSRILMNLGLGIPGDGRCLFRSVVHGACLRAGKPSPSEARERELADELRAKATEELIKRRRDTEWFVEGDFDAYVRQMRLPHTWGGEPELLMSSHVLQVPITVHMFDKKTNSLKVIAEYGQEYGKENPIRVLYHGYGHYDALRSSFGCPLSKMNTRQ